MAVFTTTASGNISAGGTFVGGVAPAQSGTDQVVVAAGHTLTVDRDTTLGISAPTRPIAKPTITATGAGGSLPAGTYRARLVSTDGTLESSSCATSSSVTITAGQVVRVTIPALLPGATGWNVYLTNTGGAQGTEHRYATNQAAGTFDCSSASWEDGTLAYASAAALPNSDAVRTAATTSHVAISDGVKLTLKGDLVALGNVTINAPTTTAGIEFDNAGSHSAAAMYYLGCGDQVTTGAGKLIMSGTSTSKAYFRGKATNSPASGALAPLQQTSSTNPVRLDCTWGAFSNLGDANNPAVLTLGVAGYNQLLTDCVFASTCRALKITIPTATGGWILTRVTFWQSAGNTGNAKSCCAILSSGGAEVTSGTRSCETCCFNALNLATEKGGATFTNCYFDDSIDWLSEGLATTSNATLSNCFWRRTLTGAGSASTGPCQLHGNTDHVYGYVDNISGATAADSNPNTWAAPGNSGTRTHNAWVVEYNGDDDSGDMVSADSGTGQINQTNWLLIPNHAGKSSGTTWLPSTAAVTVAVEHCTTLVGPYGMVNINDGSTTATGKFSSVRSNLCYSIIGTAANRTPIAPGSGATPNNDVVSPANCDYNGGWNLADFTGNGASYYTWYNTKFTSAPGAHDVDLGDNAGASVSTSGPKFVDPTRNFESWSSTVRGHAGTRAQIISAGLTDLKSIADTTDGNHVVGLLMTDPLNWVRAGFAPQNVLLKNAGHDGVTIGAVEGVWPASLGGRRSMLGLGA